MLIFWVVSKFHKIKKKKQIESQSITHFDEQWQVLLQTERFFLNHVHQFLLQ